VAQVRELEHSIDEALVVWRGLMWPAEHENMIVYRNIRRKWDVQEEPTTEIVGMQTKDMNEVEMRKQGLLTEMHKN
jgi:hypothetical protein